MKSNLIMIILPEDTKNQWFDENIKSKFDNNLLYLDLLERIEVFGFCNLQLHDYQISKIITQKIK